MRTARFVIPGLPTSANRYLGRHWGAVRGKQGAGTEWRDMAQWALVVARQCGDWDGAPFPRALFRFRFYVPDRRRRDLDNLAASMKAVVDGMRPAVVPDDDVEHIPVLIAEFAGVDPANPKVEVVVEELPASMSRAGRHARGNRRGGE